MSSPRPLTVCIDATPLLGHRTGVGEMTYGLLEALATRTDVRPTVYSFAPYEDGEIARRLPPGVPPRPARPTLAARLETALRHRARSPAVDRTADVVHGTNYELPPWWRRPAVVTVHDLTTLRYPELCHAHTLRFPTMVRRAVDRGAFVHTVSAFVAEEVAEHLGVPRDRVRVAHPALPSQAPAEEGAGRRAAGGARYVLALGTIEPRKDLPALVAAFDRVAASDSEVRLVVAGPEGWGTRAFLDAVRRASHHDRIVRLGYVDPSTRSGLLADATVLAFPSLYEGFGFPPLEAMSAGTAVVATAVGGVPEVVGDAAVLVPPRDVDALAAALESVLGDDGARTAMVERGRRRAADFSWAAFAEGMSALYRDAVAN